MSATTLFRHHVCRAVAAVERNGMLKRFESESESTKLTGKKFAHLYSREMQKQWKVDFKNARKQCIREVELQRRRDIFQTPEDKLFSARRRATYQRSLILNELENARIAAYRAIRRAREKVKRDEQYERGRIFAEAYHKEMTRYRADKVKQEMEMEYITKSTLNKKIDEALDNPVDHTYAIGLDGAKLKPKAAPATTTTDVEDDLTELEMESFDDIKDLYK